MHNGERRDFESQPSQVSTTGLISKSPTSSTAYDNRDGEFWTSRMKCGVCSIVACILFIFILVLLGNSAHKIMEGTVGIYFRGGALQETVNNPGIHFTVPFITEVKRIKIRPRTDTLKPITAVTKDGIQNTFNNVEVISDVNPMKVVALVRKYGLEFHKTLVFDRIFEEIRILCAANDIDAIYSKQFLEMVSHVTNKTKKTISKLGEGGITIYHLTIPKPDIPPDIAANYKEVKVQWTAQLVAKQQQQTEEIRKKTEEMKAVADANRTKIVEQITIQKKILQWTLEDSATTPGNQIHKDREENKANIENYSKRKLADANSLLFKNPGYVQLEMAKSLPTNTKFIFSG